MLKTKYLNLLVLLPTNTKNDESTREKCVKINTEEDRKMGMSSIKDIGTQFFSGIDRNIYGVHVSSLN